MWLGLTLLWQPCRSHQCCSQQYPHGEWVFRCWHQWSHGCWDGWWKLTGDKGPTLELALEDQGNWGDQSDLSNGPNLIEQTALQQFASALQDAQRLAVELERDQASQKQRMPNTYQGDLRTTCYHRGKARQALAAKGFLDIRSFLELKQCEQYEWQKKMEHKHKGEHGEGSSSSQLPASTDWMLSGGHSVSKQGEQDEDDIILLPGPLNCAQDRGGGAYDKGSKIAGVEGRSATANVCGLDLGMHTWCGQAGPAGEGVAHLEEVDNGRGTCPTSCTGDVPTSAALLVFSYQPWVHPLACNVVPLKKRKKVGQ